MEKTRKIRDNGSIRLQQSTIGPSMVEKNHREECNINMIVAKAKKTGLFPTRTDRPTYGDFTGTADFQEAHNRIIEADKDFLKLPADIRKRFHNDAGEFLTFIYNPDNRQEAEKLGLLPSQPVEPKEAPPATPEPETILKPAPPA